MEMFTNSPVFGQRMTVQRLACEIIRYRLEQDTRHKSHHGGELPGTS